MRRIILTILSLWLAVSTPAQFLHTYFTEVGILVQNAGATVSDKADIIRNTLHSRYVRFTAISMQNWTGSSAALDTYKSAGLIAHVVIDVGFGAGTPNGWITSSTAYDLTDLSNDVDELLTDNPDIKILVLDNEELNDNYHDDGRVFQYLDIAAVVQAVCRAHGVLLSNAGFGNFFAINGYVFRWIKSKYVQTAADTFGDYVFLSPGQYNAANTVNSNPSLETLIKSVDTIVSSSSFDILDIHIYNPPGDQTHADTATYAYAMEVWRFYKECFTNANPDKKRLVSCNEFGQRSNSNASLTTNMLDMFWQLAFLFADAWSGNGTDLDAESFTEDDGTIKDNGQAYANWQDAHYTPIAFP
jgi:hypothetical protein